MICFGKITIGVIAACMWDATKAYFRGIGRALVGLLRALAGM